MLATVIWLGGLATLALLVLPAARSKLDSLSFAALLEGIQKRLDPLGWLCLAVLLATGMFQMSASPNYSGFLSISNRWATAILVKHLVILGMVAISAWMTWGVLPALRRAALQRALGKPAPQTEALQRRELTLLRLNLLLGGLVLLLTAIARAS
jgi:uncharacterized membrane protein